MQHLIIEQCLAGHPLPIPHFIKTPTWNRIDYYDAIIESERIILVGDEIGYMKLGIFQKTATIIEIIERRKAKGDWSLNTYDKHPYFIKFKAA